MAVSSRDDKAPVHERCTQHPFKCGQIKRIEEEGQKLWSALGKYLPTKVILTLHGILGALYVVLFGVSINLNIKAIDRVDDARTERNEQLLRVADAQRDLTISIVQLKSIVEHNVSGIQNCERIINKVQDSLSSRSGMRRGGTAEDD